MSAKWLLAVCDLLAILLKSPVLVHNQLQVQGSLLTDITLEIFVDLNNRM